MTAPPASGSTPFLSVRGLSKTFGRFTALKAVDLDVGKGEFVCFLGPSGCGKTTLLRAIAGLDPQSAGSVSIAAATSRTRRRRRATSASSSSPTRCFPTSPSPTMSATAW